MGMYTELYVNACIKPDPGAVTMLKFMTGQISDLPVDYEMPEHNLFRTSRWTSMLRSSSYYFVPSSVCQLVYDNIAECWCLTAVSSFKNYDNEIREFFDWLMPYVDEEAPTLIGYHRYEEQRTPELVFSN